MLKLRNFVMAKKIAFVILFCVPLEIMQPLIRADSAVACVAIHNSAMLSYLLNSMRYLMVQKKGDVLQYGI